MNKSYNNWIKELNNQIDFYKKSSGKKRFGGEFWNWNYSQISWLEQIKEKTKKPIRPLYNRIFNKAKVPYSKEWLNEKSQIIWETRQILQDDLSKLLFDNHLILSAVGYENYYFPRVNFQDLIEITKEENFAYNLPNNYINSPLKIYSTLLHSQDNKEIMTKIISTKLQIELTNYYRQYFIERENFRFTPQPGEIIFDCGSCIGDISTIFSAQVAPNGEVHTFDPVPLHIKYCQLHKELNPDLDKILKINQLAVGNESKTIVGEINDAEAISPGGCAVSSFELTTLDNYVARNEIKRVDYIKMDIEGFEIDALNGSADIISRFKPRLAISAYHKDSDLWEIPALIKKLNPEYKIYFGQHQPKFGESAYYAI